ncbi:hypothetical protein K0M31_003741 [Melipona bicolor]|uniref:Uncharacterized protein n=1 Tax=Melipona bicolor TaxID=60889 RepID=A0AA40FXJ4_9HYME|nr:hypothetical protein K0M31_003741 [Melipona bicolor]
MTNVHLKISLSSKQRSDDAIDACECNAERIIVLLGSDNFPIRRNARAVWEPFFICMLPLLEPVTKLGCQASKWSTLFPQERSAKDFRKWIPHDQRESRGESGHRSKPIWSWLPPPGRSSVLLLKVSQQMGRKLVEMLEGDERAFLSIEQLEYIHARAVRVAFIFLLFS